MTSDQIAGVRRFNRLVTQRAGALDDHFLGRDRPLGASRVLYDIGPDGADLREVRAHLSLDSGYLSRLVQSLETAGLVTLGADPTDERVRRATLTGAGQAEVREMDRRADEVAQSTLAPLSERQRERLAAAMAEVCLLLTASGTTIERVDPAGREARWCVARYCDELDRRFEAGFDPGKSLPADESDFRPPTGSFLVAMADGEPIAGGAVKAIGLGVGTIKRMWVADRARGLGFGRRMLVALEDEARRLGIVTLHLETNQALEEAIALYRRSGYVDVAAFNDDPYATHWFEKRLA